MHEIRVTDRNGAVQMLQLKERRMTLGRSLANDFPFRSEPLLSKHHLAFVPEGPVWFLEDLGSLNGTVLNGRLLRGRQEVKPGARISAGGLLIEFVVSQATPAAPKVTFLPGSQSGPTTAASIDSSMGILTGRTPGRLDAGMPQMAALRDASQALSEHLPLDRIFPLILNLALNTVRAKRGLVLEFEDGRLTTKAMRGGDLRVSNAVLDRVIERRESLLVQDVTGHEASSGPDTLPQDQTLSVLAVPLLTETELLGLVYVDSPSTIRAFTDVDLALLTVLGNIAALNIDRTRRERRELEDEISQREARQAVGVWLSLLPAQAPEVPGYELAGASIPCRSVGGDYFDFVPLPDGRLAILLGDVVGKGMPAALLMSGVHSSIHLLAEEGPELGVLVTKLNRHLARIFKPSQFLTLFMMALDPATGEFDYVNAGHNPPYLVRAADEPQPLTGGGPVLGIINGISYQALCGRLQPGETLVVYSDGLTEARSPDGEEFGEERLEALLRNAPGGAETTMDAIFRCGHDFTSSAPPHDDLTVVVVHRQTAGAGNLPPSRYNDP